MHLTDKNKVNQIRAFIALSLTEDVVVALGRVVTPLREKYADKNINWVPPSNYHITLSFLGNIPIADVKKLEDIMETAGRDFKPFTVQIGKMGLFPEFERNGIFVAAVKPDEPLMTLQSTLERALKEASYKLQHRPYRPHVTIARLKKNIIPDDMIDQPEGWLENPVSALHLYKSERIDGVVVNSIVTGRSLT